MSVDGTKDAKGRVVATTITVDGDDIESSQMIQAGLQPTADQVLEQEKTMLKHQEQIGATNSRLRPTKRTSKPTSRRSRPTNRELNKARVTLRPTRSALPR